MDLFQYQEDKGIKQVLEQIYKPVENMNVKKNFCYDDKCLFERFYDGNSYQAILYNKNAQEFVVEKLREMLSK